jgi:aspartate/methionine/tyrosine aminotransferase
MLARHDVADSMALARCWLADIGVATSPGADFDLDDGGRWLRLCYAGPNQDVAEAASLIARWSLR